MEKSGNPALKDSAINRVKGVESTATATIAGTTLKVVILMIILSLGAWTGWRMAANNSSALPIVLIGTLFGAMAFAFATIFAPKASPITAPIYALLEGVLLGAISQLVNESYGGIALQALLLTGGVFVSVLILYTSRAIRVTQKTRAVIIAATLGVALYYLVALIFGLFGVQVPLIYDSGTFGIVFSIIVVLIAALNLLLDFDFIERTAQNNAPKVFEWYGAFSLTVTLVWLYLEILRLLGKARS